MVAPRIPTIALANSCARTRIFGVSQPLTMPKIKTLLKASPAPTVSTIWVVWDGIICWRSPFGWKEIAPALPWVRVMLFREKVDNKY